MKHIYIIIIMKTFGIITLGGWGKKWVDENRKLIMSKINDAKAV